MTQTATGDILGELESGSQEHQDSQEHAGLEGCKGVTSLHRDDKLPFQILSSFGNNPLVANRKGQPKRAVQRVPGHMRRLL